MAMGGPKCCPQLNMMCPPSLKIIRENKVFFFFQALDCVMYVFAFLVLIWFKIRHTLPTFQSIIGMEFTNISLFSKYRNWIA